jgi:hypothetical protein
MKGNKRKAGANDKPIRVVCYMRVGTIEQLSPEAQREYLNSQMESRRKGEKHDADSDS